VGGFGRSPMKNGTPKRRLIRLSVAAFLSVGIGFTGHYFLRRPATFKFDEVLWVKKDDGFHAPGSSVSRAVIDLLHPDYIDFNEMTFSGPVLLLHDKLGDLETADSRKPLWLIPYVP
jgi:hypothetical protein